MSFTSALVLFAVIWFMTLFVVLPFRLTTQGEAGKVEPGTHAGAPAVHHLKKKAIITTVIAAIIWSIAATVIFSGSVTVEDLDIFDLSIERH